VTTDSNIPRVEFANREGYFRDMVLAGEAVPG